MEKVIVATKNEYKLKEFRDMVPDPSLIELIGLDTYPDIGEATEDGNSFLENAKKKALYVFDRIKKPVIADDSGLMVDHLNGAPGILSSRFSGRERDYKSNNTKLLQLLKGVENRKARFVSVIVYISQFNDILDFHGICEGEIAHNESGTNGFGYDPVFIPQGYSKSMAELHIIEKNRISHRGNAFAAFFNYFKKPIR